MNGLILLMLPITTGLASVLWSRLAAASSTAVTCLSVLGYAIVAASLAATEPRAAAWPSLAPAVGYVVLTVIVAQLWLRALSGASIGSCALAEAGYPVVVLIASRALGDCPPPSWTTCAGAALVLVGAPLIAIGG